MITFTLETITPQIAEAYLSKNDDKNRGIRFGSLKEYVRCMEEGSWQLTHQAIAFDCTGKLIDGQHRLRAIVKSGTTQQMYVARYDSSETSMKLSIDRNARRTIADVLHIDKKYIETASAMLTMAFSQTAVTVHEVEELIQVLKPYMDTLNAACNSTAKIRSSACIKCAVLCEMILSPKNADEIASQYRAFVLLNFDDCCDSVKAFLKTLDSMSARSGSDRMQLFSRASKAFKYASRNSKVNRYGDSATENNEARKRIVEALEAIGYPKGSR